MASKWVSSRYDIGACELVGAPIPASWAKCCARCRGSGLRLDKCHGSRSLRVRDGDSRTFGRAQGSLISAVEEQTRSLLRDAHQDHSKWVE